MSLGAEPTKTTRFNRLPFQQLMILDMYFMMIDRCGLSEYRSQLTLYLKHCLGLDWLTVTKVGQLTSRFDTNASGQIIPRRHGKSVLCAILIMLVLGTCVGANIKCLYTAHTLSLIDTTFGMVVEHLVVAVGAFNDYHYSGWTAGRNDRKPTDFYYRANVVLKRSHKSARVDFSVVNDRDAAYVVSKNELRCQVYRDTNCLRGATFNTIFVDECNFIDPRIYSELLPMMVIDGSRMMMLTSAKSGQDNRPFIDLNSVRRNGILINSVTYVCTDHVLELIKSNTVVMRCLCYYHAQPLHINTDIAYKNLASAFSRRTVNGVLEDSPDAVSANNNDGDGCRQNQMAKSTLLSEIGVLPPGITTDHIGKLNMVGMRLASDAGTHRMMIELVDVYEHIVVTNESTGAAPRTSGTLLFERDVVVYIDPAPTDTERSHHAIAFVARATQRTHANVAPLQHYVLLGVEEFTTSDMDATYDSGSALASVFMYATLKLTRWYGGYFNRFLVIPEANSIAVDRFWFKCGVLLVKDVFRSVFARHSVRILASIM